MKRVLVCVAILLAIGAFVVIAGGASNNDSAAGTYKIELDNAFGLVSGADFKVAGVRAGKIESIDLPKNCIDGGGNPTCHALVTVQVTQNGFGTFKSDAFCQSRPQSLIGEYFIDCQPGQYGKTLKAGSTIPVSHTESTIPADLVQDVMRLPYRQRFTLIINELGAAVAGRSGDLQAALRRAVPALTETDNLLNLLANDSHTLQQLTAELQLGGHRAGQQLQAGQTGSSSRPTTPRRDTAAQDSNLRVSLQRLPGLLEQLRPAMAKLGAAADANEPVLANLNSARPRTSTRCCATCRRSRSLRCRRSGRSGRPRSPARSAVQAANPTIKHLNQFAKPTPELAQNLSIVLHDLDNRSRAVEPDPRSPGGKGFTGLEALLQYAFNQPLAINTFGPFGHLLAVDAFVNSTCTPYATPATIAPTIKQQGVGRRALVLLGARPQPAGRHHDRPDEPQRRACPIRAARLRARRAPRPAPASCRPPRRPPTGRAAATMPPARQQRRTRRLEPPDTGTPGRRRPARAARASSARRRSLAAIERGLRPRGRRPGRARRDLAGAGRRLASSSSTSSPRLVRRGGQTQQLLNYLLSP